MPTTGTGGKRRPEANPAGMAAPAWDRRLKGQFDTPPGVCDLMLGLVLRDGSERLLDAGFGTGAFLLRAYDFYRAQALGAPRPLDHLHGVELDRTRAETGLRLLLARHAGPLDGPPPLWVGNFIGPLPDAFRDFDVIVGNPPYVRHEHLRQSKAMDKQAAGRYLQNCYQDYLCAHPHQKALFAQTADLYAWFFMRAQLLLKPGGRLAFITSNSWLDTAFGRHFSAFLADHFHVDLLLESACERWFADAAVNPLILVLRKKAQPEKTGPPTRLVRFHRPLSEWLPDPARPGYWPALAERLETLHAGRAAESGVEVREPPARDRTWGMYLRTPETVRTLLEDTARWQPLSETGTVRYPLKTGINRFFYLTHAEASARGIEPEFLIPLVKSGRDVTSWHIHPDDCRRVLFSCTDTPEALEAAGRYGALAYIRWGEGQVAAPRQKRQQAVPWPEVASVKNNRPWYAIRPLPPAELLCNRFFDQRYFFARCHGTLVEDQTFYGFRRHAGSPWTADFIAALLNTTLSCLLVELRGRRNLGEGVLQFARADMAAFPLPHPARFSPARQAEIAEAFHAMGRRAILPMTEETAMPDRRALDRAVLKAAGWDPALGDHLAECLLARMRERIRLARSGRR